MSMANHLSTALSDGDAKGVRRVATGLLIGLTLVFLATYAVDEPSTSVLLIRAMAEAGMIGAIADWFAVEALFRRPLGLPIPHTALLPRNKDRAANNIARFIDEFFLAPDQIVDRVRAMRPAERTAHWLSRPENAQMIATELTGVAGTVVASVVHQGLSARLKARIGLALAGALNTDDLAPRLANVLREALKTDFTVEAIRTLSNTIDTNRSGLIRVAQEKSRWWIAGSVDRRIVTLLLNAVIELLDRIAEPESDLGRDFRRTTEGVVTRLERDGTLSLLMRDLLHAPSDGQAASAAIGEAMEDVLEGVLKRLEDDPDATARLIGQAIQSAATDLSRNPVHLAYLDAQLSRSLVPALSTLRPSIATYIAQTIKEWDSELLVDRIEREVGRDLQFIRINGAVLGALVGGAIFGVTQGFLH
ncbi:MAG: DUF445 domain-containing protein [Dinoroseobacter sp.]|nr:DUF445 domain-containing protein [Dinoroseobacter sp.]